MELLALVCKGLLFLLLWAMLARMFYLNEVACHPDDRVTDLDSAKLLAAVWPLWGFGMIISLAVWVLWRVIDSVSTHLTLTIRNYKESQCLKHPH